MTTFNLTHEQKVILSQKIAEGAQDGHYGKAYKYMEDIVPMSDLDRSGFTVGVYNYTKEEAGLRM